MLNQADSKQEASVPQPKGRNIDAIHSYRFKYLRSEHWSNLRLEKMASVDAVCRKCRKRDLSNDVHHLNYRKLYDVELTDLVVLCRECHGLAHRALDYCRQYIKGSEKAWLATRQMMVMIEAADEVGIPAAGMESLQEPHYIRSFWKTVLRLRRGEFTSVESELLQAKQRAQDKKELYARLLSEGNTRKYPDLIC